MKQYGFTGKGTGKLGSAVFAISGGEQIVRQYNPVVANPQTEAQVAQRAKFKLLTQLAAAMSGQIAFRKSGITSARNMFVSKNIALASYENMEANIDIASIDLTSGSLTIPQVTSTRGAGEAVTIALASSAAGDIKRVIYNLYKITEGNKIEFIKEVLASEAGENRTFEAQTTAPEADIVVYAYGIKDTNTRTTTKFEEYEASADTEKATLDVLRALNNSDYVLTATSGVVLPFSGGTSSFQYVSVNSEDWNGDKTINTNRADITCFIPEAGSDDNVFLLDHEDMPEEGYTYPPRGTVFSKGEHNSFYNTVTLNAGTKYWLCVGSYDGEAGTVREAYPYYITYQN